MLPTLRHVRSPTAILRNTCWRAIHPIPLRRDRRLLSSQTAPRDGLHILTLPTGRKLSYRTYGPSTGQPIFWLHGTPSSATEGLAFKSAIQKLNIQLICPNRPGFGASDFQPGRTISDHGKDVLAIADNLSFDTFRVMGGSGGGPHSLGCAKVIPKDRMTGVGVVAGATPWDWGMKGMGLQGRLSFSLYRYAPWLGGWTMRRDYDKKLRGRSYEEVVKVYTDLLPKLIKMQGVGKRDKEVCHTPGFAREVGEIFAEAMEMGVEGAIYESSLIVNKWDFRVEDIEYEGIKLYWGVEDMSTPLFGGQKFQQALRKAKLMECQGVGHWSIFVDHLDRIMEDMIKD